MQMITCSRALATIIILLLTTAGCGKSYSGRISPRASSGILDLRDWNFDTDGQVHLSGEWEFYWKQLLSTEDFNRAGIPRLTSYISLPEYWNSLTVKGRGLPAMGYATHRLKILLPKKTSPLAVRNTAIATSFRLFIDGRLVRYAGVVGMDGKTARPEYDPGVTPVATSGREMTLILQVSNFHHYHGGVGEVLILGKEDELLSQWKKMVFFELFLFGSIIIIGLYHFGIFLLMRKDKSPLYFCIYCFCIAFFNQFSGELFFYKLFLNDLGWASRFLLVNLCVYLFVPSLLMFLSTLFPKEIHKRFIQVTWVIVGIFSAVALTTPTYIYAWGFALFQIYILVGLSYCFISLVLACFRKRQGALIMLTGFMFFFITALIDALSFNNIIPFYLMSSAIGLFIFIVSQAYLLAGRFAAAFHAEERLARDLRSVIENIQDIFYRGDAMDNLIMASPSFLTQLGYESLDECLGKPIAETFYYDPEKRAQFLRYVQDTGSVTNYEVVLKRRDGTPIIVEANSHLYYDSTGALAGVEGVFRDISERKRAEEVLLKNAHLLQTLMDAIPNPIFYKDTSGIFQGCNTAFEAYIGLDMSKIVGKSVYDISPEELADRYHEMDTALFIQGGIQFYESLVRYTDGTLHNVIFNKATYTNADGSLAGLVGVILDITERKQKEKQLEISLKEKETLLRELYHRTKNTMQVIRSMLYLQAAKSPTNDQLQKLVKDMENRILAISLVHEKLYQSHDLSRINMQEYIDSLAHLIIESYALTQQHISLKLDIQPISMLLDTAIPCGLILNELLSNALKYAFPGERKGEISIRMSRNKSENLELHVSDNGIGVPEMFEFRKQETLGLQSIIAIAEHQLQGRVEFAGDHGVACMIEFPDTLYQERV